MSRYIVFLRGVMPTGRTKVPMAEARAALIKTGFIGVRSQIASGNFLLDCQELGQETKAGCEARVAAQVQAVIARDIGPTLAILVRSPKALTETLAAHPFGDGRPNQVLVAFLPSAPSADVMQAVSTRGREQVRVLEREVFIHDPDGIGRSKLKLPKVMQSGTARNLNTLRKLLAMAGEV